MKPHKKNFLFRLKNLLLGISGFALLALIGLALTFVIVNRTSGTIVSSGERRTYLLHVPAAYNPQTPTPLVVSIHGFAEWPAHQAHVSRWNDLADREGFIVVYPSGTDFPKRWRTAGLTGEPVDTHVDSQFIADLIDTLESKYNIDSNRIFANGLSNGGGMSYLLACDLADQIAAIGGVAGAYTYPADKCSPSRPVPLIAFHGTSDPIVPYEGGPSRSFDVPFPVVPEWMQAWAERNQCLTFSSLPREGEISSITYSDCSLNADVVFYTIHGGGHSWPGGNPLPTWIVGSTSQQIDATQFMWEFFVNHPLQP